MAENMQWRFCFHTTSKIIPVFYFTSKSNSWDQFSVPSDFLPAQTWSTDHHITSFTSLFSWAEKLKCCFLDIPLTFSPGDVSCYFLPRCISMAAQQALPTCIPFAAVSQISVVNSPSRWLHLSTSSFSAFTSSNAPLILVPLHTHQVKNSSSNSLLRYCKSV